MRLFLAINVIFFFGAMENVLAVNNANGEQDAVDPPAFLSIDARQFNSKVFYVITEGAGLGDNVRRIPFTGNDTVLDAISAVDGQSGVSGVYIWVARPTSGGFGCKQILPVDYDAITRGESATNYQLMPGDLVFISEIESADAVQTSSNNEKSDGHHCKCKRKRTRRKLLFGKRRISHTTTTPRGRDG